MTQHKINDEITSLDVMLIDVDGVKRGTVKLEEAKSLASQHGMDLVQFSDNEIPVVKILNYEKFCYNLKKIEKDRKKANKEKGIKEIVIGVHIDKNDLKTKINKIIDLLEEKYKVKVEVKLRGRDLRYKPEAQELVRNVCAYVSGEDIPEVKVNDGLIFAVISPKSKCK